MTTETEIPSAALQTLSDEQIMEIGHRHFKPNPDLTDSAKAAFVASMRECIGLVAAQLDAAPAAVVEPIGNGQGEAMLLTALPVGTLLYAGPGEGQAPAHAAGWRDMTSAPKDGTLLRLLVEFEDHATEDGEGPQPTIGSNTWDNHHDFDEWQFAGWNWEHDCYTQGIGKAVGWLPMLDDASGAAIAAHEQPKCTTCNDNGMIGGPSFREPDEGGLPCPDCTASRNEPPAASSAETPSEKQKKLLDLADRIDHEQLWRWAGMNHHKMTPEQRDRMNAGVALRRYANLWAPGRWLVFPPEGPVHFGASTLDKAVEMAKKRDAR